MSRCGSVRQDGQRGRDRVRRRAPRGAAAGAGGEPLERRALLAVIFQTSGTVTTSDNGGPIIATPHVALVFWGAAWSGSPSPSIAAIQNAANVALTSAYVRNLQSYRAAFNNGSIFSTYTITTSSPPANFTTGTMSSFLQTNINNGTLPRPTVDSQLLYMIIPQSGSTDPTEGLGGFHSYLFDNLSNLAHYGWVINNGSLDTISSIFSHELVEAMTDPEGTAIQVNPRSPTNWNEVSDGTAQSFSARLGGVLLQSYWLQSKGAYIIGTGVQDVSVIGGHLIVNGDQLADKNDAITLDTDGFGGVSLTMNGESESFRVGTITDVQINGLSGIDSISINDLPSGIPVTVHAGSGEDTVYVGGGDFDSNIAGNVTVSGDAGTDTIVIADTSDGTGSDGYTIASSTFNKQFGGVLTYDTSEGITINGSPFGSTYDVDSLAIPLTINASGANDAITIGGSIGDIDSFVNGNVIVHGNGGADALVFNDGTDDASVNDSYTLFSSTFDKSSTTELYSFDTVESINLIAGLASNQIDVNNTVAAVTVNGGEGNDTFVVGNGDFDTNLGGVLTVNGDAGTDSIIINDAVDGPGNDAWSISSSSFTKGPDSMNYATVESITLNGSASSEAHNIESTTPSTPITIDAGAGTDKFNISTIAGTLFNIGGSVLLNGGDGNDVLEISDANFAGPANFAISPTVVTLPFNGATATYSTIESLIITSGSGANVFNVNGTAGGVPVVISAGDGSDTLNVNGLTSSFLTFNGGANTTGSGDGMTVTGIPGAVASYNPSATTFGSGNVGFNGQGIDFSGLDTGPGVTMSSLLNLSFNTPNPVDSVDVDSLIALGLNILSGTSGGVSMLRLIFSNVTNLLLDTGTADTALAANDVVTVFANGLLATGLNTFRFAGGTLPNNADTLNIQSGPLTFNTDASLDTRNLTLNVSHAAGPATNVKFDATQHLAALNISNDARAALTPGAAKVLVTNALTVGAAATLDLADSDAVIDYTGASPLAAIRAALASGFASGAWIGAGINSSSAAANPIHDTALGYAESSAVLGPAGGTFSGVLVDATALLVKYTFNGDANLDGRVDTLDFNALAANFGGTGRNWWQADFNFDGTVDTLDFNFLAAGFGKMGL
jgi:hypothetical protein